MKTGVSQTSLRILVADDNPSDRLIMEALLRRQGHEALLAKDGREAVALFESAHPDLVLLDVMMPELDGIAAAKRMRELAGNELIPIIFLTALNDARDLAECLEAGGDDFLSKPYNPVVLQAKIKAFSRLRRLHLEVRMQREHLIGEQRAAKSIFDRIANLGALDAENIRYLMSPMAIFNGDVLLVAQQPGGDMLVLLGDFTGHGMPAAMGIMPLAEIFYGMARKNFGLEAVLHEINARLHAVLPRSIFCCATAVQMNYRNRHIEIWAGGLPEGLIHHYRSGERVAVPSRHLPLGILPAHQFSYLPMVVEMCDDIAVYLWSDGIIEAQNPSGEMFGTERLHTLLRQAETSADMFAHIIDSLRTFTQQGSQSDDYSLVEIRPREALAPRRSAASQKSRDPVLRNITHWSLEYELRTESLKTQDPVPMLMHLLMQVPGMQAHGGVISTILTELYSNALEHGLLGLASAMKSDAEGFHHYYQLRSERLQALTEASIRIRAEVLPLAEGGVLRLRMKDSGPGFTCENHVPVGHHPSYYYGRGLTLLASLCRRVEYFAPGNEVLVEYAWQDKEGATS